EALDHELEHRQAWLTAQKWGFLQEVDVGGGTHGKDLRKLAEEANCSELRSLLYQPMSSSVHGHWNSVARQNLDLCLNPLHGFHRLPAEFPRPLDIQPCWVVMDLYDRSYELLSKLLGKKDRSEASSNWFEEAEKNAGWIVYEQDDPSSE
ncbi:MAG: hypothetical protein V3T83_11675, partial [Acidobacteriota bacterium]